MSSSFGIGNGTRQGGLLSPILFNRYVADLIVYIPDSGIGCNVGGMMLNILAYADDLVLISLLGNVCNAKPHCCVRVGCI